MPRTLAEAREAFEAEFRAEMRRIERERDEAKKHADAVFEAERKVAEERKVLKLKGAEFMADPDDGEGQPALPLEALEHHSGNGNGRHDDDSLDTGEAAARPGARAAVRAAARALRANFTVHQVKEWIDGKWPGILEGRKRNTWSDAVWALKQQEQIKVMRKGNGNEGDILMYIGN